jgi:hypothetical protein
MVESERSRLTNERAKSLPPQICVGTRTGLMSLASANLDSFLLGCWIYLGWKRVVDAGIACSSRLLENGGFVRFVSNRPRDAEQKDVLFMLTDALDQQSFSNNRFVLQFFSIHLKYCRVGSKSLTA